MTKFKVNVASREGAKEVKSSDLYEDFVRAGWSDDPGSGKAVLLPDGREVVNPIPHAPPIGFVHQESVVDQVMAKLNARRIMQLQDDEEIDAAAEMNDFDVDDEVEITSVYEIVMKDDAPGMPPGGNAGGEVNVDDKSKASVVPDIKPEDPKKGGKKPPPDVSANEA